MKWMMMMVMAASSALAVETNTFTFTNKAGTVFKDARLIKAENGEAVIIAGTVGARVKLEELPTEIQARTAFEEVKQAKVTPAKKWPDGLKVDVFEDGGRREFVNVLMTNSAADAFLGLTRASDPGREPTYFCTVILSQRAGGPPDGPMSFKTEQFSIGGMAYVKENELGEERRSTGFVRASGIVLKITAEDMIRLCRAGKVELRIGTTTGELVYEFIPNEAHRALGGVLTLGLQQSIPRTGSTKGRAEAVAPTMRITSRDGDYMTYAWKFTARNNLAVAESQWFKIQFLDGSGFEVAHDSKEVRMMPNSSTTVTGSRFLKAAIGDQIRRIAVTAE